MPEIRFEFGTQDASTLRARKIDPSGLTTAQRALIDARVNDACFFSSKVSDAKLLEKMRTYIAEAAEGKRFRNRADFIREMRAYFGKSRTKDSGKLTDITSSRRLGLIFDFQQERLSAEIFLAQGEDQDHAWAFPCLELIRVSQRMVPRDWRARWKEAGGKLYDGRMIALRNDPIWRKISRFGSPVPPFDFNSGMGLEEVNRFEAEALGVELPEDDLEVDELEEALSLAEEATPKVVAATNSEANEVLKNLQGKDFVNKETGIAAQLRSTQRGKLISNKAAEKSIANGFTREQHNTAAANIGDLFERAHLFFDGPDKDGDPNIKSIKRFAALIILDKGPVEADILVKESISSGSRIYTVELQEIKKPSARGTESIKTDRGETQSTPPTTDGKHKVAEEAAKVNRVLRLL
ncbi:MAG: hypothetical protein IKW49_08645 [Opitutales bacterium]|nr:hypothetical protein [Opitutales bacterium]